jgi:hypothetical protein
MATWRIVTKVSAFSLRDSCIKILRLVRYQNSKSVSESNLEDYKRCLTLNVVLRWSRAQNSARSVKTDL